MHAEVRHGNGAVIMTSTKGERLICDPQTNQICGVKASSKGKDLYFKANKGVLLSAGGFCHNPAMLNRYVPMMKLAAGWRLPVQPATASIWLLNTVPTP